MPKAAIQRLLRFWRTHRLKFDLRRIQGYWAPKAKKKGFLTEKDLERYLRRN